MGKRIAFYEMKNGQSLRETFVENYSDFKKWTLCQNKDSIEKYNEQIISNDVENFLESNSELDLQKPEQKLLDELLTEFLLVFCDYGKGSGLVKLIGPLIGTHNYKNSFKIIAKQKNKALADIWNILKVGRSLRNGNQFTVIDGDIIGFWDRNELNYLRNELNGIENKNDIGIDCINQVLTEIGENKNELIIVTEI
ncbi:hypothetical protein EYD45_16455 [Hyunsoonleella flava]|uniref:Uncharacterized protein n=1 Tax=Hyunsoonleella flava TaxID=2527939 RepID=A0A4V2J9R4_9FLAO|nr:hypothetical protein [Hyunsoonleella flava]TBM98489.1 hypothetical protein EYD45_16455 [Hyunsoonleella flava]